MSRILFIVTRLIVVLIVASVLVIRPSLVVAQTTLSPTITAGYQDPTFKLIVTGRGFSRSVDLTNSAVVYVLGVGGVLERDVVPLTPGGMFTDTTKLGCSLDARAVTAVDTRSTTWSNQVVVKGPCL